MKSTKLVLLTVAVFSLFLTSCYKSPENPKAVITVLDENNVPVEGADVTVFTQEGRVVYLSEGAKYSETSVSDANGKVYFEFLYEAIYNIKVSYKRGHGSSLSELSGNGVLLLKEDKTCEEKIRIRE